MMMLLGGAALAVVLIPLIAIGMLVVAVIASLTGHSSQLLEQLLPPDMPGIKARPRPQEQDDPEQAVDYFPLGTHVSPQHSADETHRYKRYCQECGLALQRGWKFCPGCGQKLNWV